MGAVSRPGLTSPLIADLRLRLASSGLVDAPGRWLVVRRANARFVRPSRAPSRTDRRDPPCDPVMRRRVIVDRHPVAEQPDDAEAGCDDRQRTARANASQAPEL